MKKLVTSFTASVLALAAFPFVAPTSFTASATSTDPNIYVDIVVESPGVYRADIILENAPAFNNGSFHVNLGTSWNSVKRPNGNVDFYSNTTLHENMSTLLYIPITYTTDNQVVVSFADTDGHANYNCNGLLASFYIEKTADYDEDNDEINVENVYSSSAVFDRIRRWSLNQYEDIFPTVMNTSITMLDATEYLRGDVDDDLCIDTSDASMILAAVGNSTYSVNSLKYTYTSMFPNARCAAAMDANEDGFINSDDADAIMDYYVAVLNNETPPNNVGQVDVFEIYS
ncbi:MAG: hypothetical protein IKQ90_06855 [Ruminococcus sp.]|nr:hypothetical protein [Ruminococcus sp.]